MNVWRDSMSVGLAEIDRDHRVLLDIVNQFEDCRDSLMGEEILRHLYHYAQKHFLNEEQIQIRCGYPEAEWHKGEHDRILKQLQHIIQTSFRGNIPLESRRTAMETARPIIREMIIDHATKVDMHLIPYLGDERAEAQGEGAGHEIPYSLLRVMVIDDSSICRLTVSKSLQSIGVKRIIEASDGSDGIVIYQKEYPHLILCDLEMFPVDGLVFLTALRAEENKSKKTTPVVFMTSHTEPHNIAQAKQLGASGYLVKPVAAKELKKRIDAIFVQKRVLG